MTKLLTTLTFIATLLLYNCNKKSNPEEQPPVTATPLTPASTATPTTGKDLSTTYGYNLLDKIKGIWAGPVTSTTPLGGFAEWIVDFRPNAENQISAKNELDTLNDIFMSFFIVKHNNEYKLAFRNGGGFAGKQRVSYMLADSVVETSNRWYYRFAEVVKGKNRAYSEVIFSADSVYLKSYTNKYNTQSSSTPHMVWSAKLQDATSCAAAVTQFSFPKKTLTKDFSTTFASVTEAIYYATSGVPQGDPYPETAQPYVGKTTATFTFASNYTPNPNKKVLLIVTTQPLFSGFMFNSGNLKYRSRYVIVGANANNFAFNYMHPGTYYYYALYDADGNNTFNSGDWISTANTTFALATQGTTSTTTQINFTIP
ncbi:MAG: hypothetical protein ABL940_03420 [Bacteroidia bacterium]